MTEPRATLRHDYRPPSFLVETVDLRFELDPKATVVRSRLVLRRNPADGDAAAPLELDGEALELLSLALDGEALGENRFRRTPEGGLVIDDMPDAAVLEVATRIDPDANSELSGLYTSGGAFFTQCEAEGFRRITFFPDRPDVMARYTTTIVADRASVPVLLGNGNPTASGMDGARHWATWTDPHPKPAYLFALVAGDLVPVRDSFTTRSGRHVDLAIWVRRGHEDACGHAMESLKRSMTWDENVYGLEYDLDVFNIAAVSDFNMGAMENKGLNVFNTKYVLARPETATDADYQGIEAVIAHEYFHNWTGNRVTCRDWFQLSLKEGLTVFRDQQFSADMGSPAVKRLSDVRGLRAAQFREDAGPLAHPVRPESYIAIDNFYTATIYNKGAEVVRMLHRLAGVDGFRRGMDLYIARHDNQAVTIEDFVAAIGDGAGIDLSPFLAWYDQAGTPELSFSETFDAEARRYTLTLRQATSPTPGQPTKAPLPIPVAMGLLAPDGTQVAERMLLLDRAEQDFVFDGITAQPVPSLLRGFSAPVKLSGLSRERLAFLAAHDTDPFVRWDSLQSYAADLMLERIAAGGHGIGRGVDPGLLDAFAATLRGAEADPAFAAACLALPAEATVADRMAVVDVDAIHAVRQDLRAALGRALERALREAYARLADPGPYRSDGVAIGRRALRNTCLSYLAAAGDEALAAAQFEQAGNMTDSLAALDVLTAGDTPAREPALAAFHARWRHEELVLDKWFTLQALSPRADTLAQVRALAAHPDFDLRNPNRARSLLAAFPGNQVRFHDASGEGYRFLAEAVIALDPANSQTAARLVGPLGQWRRQDAGRQAHMRAALRSILARPGLSRGTFEQASRALGE
jgi:aminopeptidase N